jgi:hypothetical protein
MFCEKLLAHLEIKKISNFLDIFSRNFGAQEKTRTSTPFLAHGPEPCASTNSATWAYFLPQLLFRCV